VSDLFVELVRRSRLSPLFAKSALERALQRSGVDARELTPSAIEAALPEIERTLRTFLPEETPMIIESIRKLTRE
jgi:hypothetical protein